MNGTAPRTAPFIAPVYEAALDLIRLDDTTEIAGQILVAASQVLSIGSASLWVDDGDDLSCRGAIGDGAAHLAGARVPARLIGNRLAGENGVAVLTAEVAAADRVVAIVRIARDANDGGFFSAAEGEALEQLAGIAAAAMTNAARLADARGVAANRERDLGLVTELSREITSTLDLDRVLRSVVNLASRALRFDRGAIALYEHGACDIRAVAGAETIDPNDPRLKDLAVRAAWAAGIGQSFYLSDREEPASDAERTFAQIFRDDLKRDGALSGLYLPLKDDEGVIGILLFEAERTDFANQHERDLATILANQATVAVRNARLYHQVPLADTIGALAARKEAFFALPRRRRIAVAAAVFLVVGAVTLIRWPLRVVGADPVFRPLARADARPTLSGVIDRVFVREGGRVERGAPIAHLRDDELRASRDAAAAAVTEAEREAAIAAAQGNAADERLQRSRADILERDLRLVEQQLAAATIRAPVSGIVLTPRPEERVGERVEEGDVVITVGRTDSLELDFGVDERDITRVREGAEVHLRVGALPQRTFAGRVVWVAPVSGDSSSTVSFPVRAVVDNADGLLKPGMAAYARVLTEPASAAWRVLRDPARALRLVFWRVWR